MFGKPSDAQPDTDENILRKSKDIFAGNGLFMNQSLTFPSSHPAVVQAYGLEDALEQPSRAWRSWAELMADCTFGAAQIYSAMQQRKHHPNSKVLLYDFQANNPFMEADFFYGRSNHGINDLYMFNVAEDLVPEKHLKAWKQTVKHLQKAFIQFCHGISPWSPAPMDGADVQSFGPIGIFMDGGDQRIARTLQDGPAPGTAKRWSELITSIKN